MKSALTLIALLLLCLAFACSDNATAPGGHSVTFSATVMAYKCGIIEQRYNYAEYTGRTAKVTFTRSDSLKYTSITNASSDIRLRLDTGEYIITIETAYQPPWGQTYMHITGDTTGIQFWTSLSYDPPDSVVATFYYEGDNFVYDLANEHRCLKYVADHIPEPLNLNTAVRVVSEHRDLGYAYVHYLQIAVEGGKYAWRAADNANKVIRDHPDLYPSSFGFTGYFRICPGLVSEQRIAGCEK
jgi:hypothetical protein